MAFVAGIKYLGPAICRSQAVLDTFGAVIHICLTMKTATVRDLRNRFPRVAAWIDEGEPVEITKSGKPFARLVPPAPEKTPKLVKMPDIMARLKGTFGDRIFSAKEVADMRAAELAGEEGDRLPGHVVSVRVLSAAVEFPGGGGAFRGHDGSAACHRPAAL